MIATDIKECLAREPFEPFQIRSSGGQAYAVVNPFQVALMKTKIFIAAPNSDRWAELSYQHVTGLESLQSGAIHRRSKRK